ncbi:MAG: MBL fold metallo-hydrolase [Thermoplasmata archaeon]|nr:MAG: MBL fold metallo-hydrolase [Thermoplasmata archaeon]
MRFAIVCDNEALKGYKKDWGFSCFIEEKNILFDTGARGKILMENMKRMKIDAEKIDVVILSHNHWDHIGGLSALKNIPIVYVPKSFSNKIRKKCDAIVHEVSEAERILDGVFTTGEMGTFIKEQSLIVKTSKGNVVLTGCAHPGLDEIVKKAREFGEIYAVIGGFHAFSDMTSIADIPLIVPCHCSCYKKKMKKFFRERCIECGAGKIIEI